MSGRPWTDAETAYLREHYPHRRSDAIASELGVDIKRVYARAKKLGIQKTREFLRSPESGLLVKGQTRPQMVATQFPKGHVPANKGLRRPGWAPGRMAETQFKKGEMAGAARLKWKQVGTIMADSEGYQRIKLRERQPGKERGWNSNVWRLLHWHVWEQANGPIPEGHVVAFKDGNRANCVIDNLELIPRAELARRNRMWNVLPKELAEVIHLTGQLKRKLRRMEQKANA